MNKERESGSRAWDLSHTGLRGGGEPVAVWESSELNPFIWLLLGRSMEGEYKELSSVQTQWCIWVGGKVLSKSNVPKELLKQQSL